MSPLPDTGGLTAPFTAPMPLAPTRLSGRLQSPISTTPPASLSFLFFFQALINSTLKPQQPPGVEGPFSYRPRKPSSQSFLPQMGCPSHGWRCFVGGKLGSKLGWSPPRHMVSVFSARGGSWVDPPCEQLRPGPKAHVLAIVPHTGRERRPGC